MHIFHYILICLFCEPCLVFSGSSFQALFEKSSRSESQSFPEDPEKDFPLEQKCKPGETTCPKESPFEPSVCLASCKICDGKVDCPRASDEIGCLCRSRLDSKYICDGVVHCEDISDELGCQGCKSNELSCPNESGQKNCVRRDSFCEGKYCPIYDRNLMCKRLSIQQTDSSETSSFQTNGYMMSYVKGKWVPVCGIEHPIADHAVNELCFSLTGSRSNNSYKVESLLTEYHGFWGALRYGRSFYSKTPLSFETILRECKNRMVLYVKCAPPSCQQNELPTVSSDPRIVGGLEAYYQSWRHIAAINRNGEYRCGGSIINSRWILSAAHCFLKITGTFYDVITGSPKTNSYFPGSQRSAVSHIFVHDKFDVFSMTNDIALVRLKTPIQLNRWNRPACFGGNVNLKPGKFCKIAGYGFTAENGTLASDLSEIVLPLLDEIKCLKDFSFVDREKILCAGYEKGGKDSCQGDSGSPFMCFECEDSENPSLCLDKSWSQEGLVSYGKGCARPGVAGVYTKISSHMDWIKKNIARFDANFDDLPRNVPISTCVEHACLHKTGMCLKNISVCDGKVDCFDGSDEVDCDSKSPRKAPVITPLQLRKEEEKCDRDQYRCSEIPQCIPVELACDQIRHCRDGTDEIGCYCVDRLLAMHEDWICDAMPDCFDLGDEYFCNRCGLKKWFCPRSSQCIEYSMRCDGKVQCRYGEDELNCVGLMENGNAKLETDKEQTPVSSQKGDLILYDPESKLWSPVCTSELSFAVATDVCSYLGYEPPTSIQYTENMPKELIQYNSRSKRSSSIPSKLGEAFLHSKNFQGRTINSTVYSNGKLLSYHHLLSERSKTRTRRSLCTRVHIECGPRKCGYIHDLQFVKSPPLGIVSNLPWAIHIAINGQYRCGGTLVGPQWAIAPSDCVNNIKSNLFVVAGSFRETVPLRLLGAREVAFRVDGIIPMEELKMSLVHLEESVEDYKYISWVCLDEDSDTTLPETECIIAGRYKEYLARTILVRPNSTCPGNSFCADYFPDVAMCTNTWSGLVTCRSSRKDSSWYGAAIWQSNEDKCSSPREHRLLTPKDIIAIQEAMEKSYTPRGLVHCDGHSCPMGVCALKSDVCSGSPECSDLTDEPNSCKPLLQSCKTNNDGICECNNEFFKCADGVCVDSSKVCDGIANCAAADDEESCSCTLLNDFSLVKIPCDGVIDCRDETDEINCGCDTEEEFRCYSSENLSPTERCINRTQVCDAKQDCPDGEDERHCVTIARRIAAEENAVGAPSVDSEGYLLLRYAGDWFTTASSSWDPRRSDKVCLKFNLGQSSVTTERVLNITNVANEWKTLLRREVSENYESQISRQKVVYIQCVA